MRKKYIYSPSLHQDLYENLFKVLSTYLPINIIPNIHNQEDIDLVIDEIVHIKNFEKSDIEIKTYLNEKEKNDPRVEAMCK